MAIINPEIYNQYTEEECLPIAYELASKFRDDAAGMLKSAVDQWDVIKSNILASLPNIYTEHGDELTHYTINRALGFVLNDECA